MIRNQENAFAPLPDLRAIFASKVSIHIKKIAKQRGLKQIGAIPTLVDQPVWIKVAFRIDVFCIR